MPKMKSSNKLSMTSILYKGLLKLKDIQSHWL